MHTITRVKRKTEKNIQLLEVNYDQDGNSSTHTIAFNTPQFEELLQFYKLKSTNNDENYLELIKYSIEKLKQIDDYFIKSVDITLKLILNDQDTTKYQIKDVYSYIRKFLCTYKPSFDASKQDFYILIIKILIKFTIYDDNFINSLIDNGIYELIIVIINDADADNASEKNTTQILAYSLYLLFKLSIQERFLEVINGDISRLKTVLMYILENKQTGRYSQSIILSSFLCFCNLNDKNMIDGLLIRLCNELVIEYWNRNDDIFGYKIVLNDDIEDYEYIKSFNLFDSLISIKKIVDGQKDDAFKLHFNTFEKLHLHDTRGTRYEKYFFDQEKEPGMEIGVLKVTVSSFIDDIAEKKRLDLKKLDLLLHYDLNETLNDEWFDELIKFLGKYDENCILLADSSYFDTFLNIFELYKPNDWKLLILIYKIFIRKCILKPESRRMYEKKLQNLTNSIETNDEIIVFIKSSFNLSVKNTDLVKKMFLWIDRPVGVINRVEMFDFLSNLLDTKIEDETCELLRTQFFDGNYFEKILKYLSDACNDSHENSFEIKTIFELFLRLFKRYKTFLPDFAILKNILKDFKFSNYSFINFHQIINELLSEVGEIGVVQEKLSFDIQKLVVFEEFDKIRLSDIFSNYKLAHLLNDEKVLHDFIEVLIQSLNNNYDNSEVLYLAGSIDYFTWFIEIAEMITTIKKEGGLVDSIIFLIFKVYLRKNILEYDLKDNSNRIMKLLFTVSNNNLVKTYFSNELNEDLVKKLIFMLQNSLKSDKIDGFCLNTFENYEYLKNLLNRNLGNEISEYIKLEFFDKSCFEAVITNLFLKYTMYGNQEKLEYILDLKAILELMQYLLKRFVFTDSSYFTKFIRFVNDFKPIDNQYVNLNTLVEDLRGLVRNVSSKNSNEAVKPVKIIYTEDTIRLELEERAQFLKTIADFYNYEYTRQNYMQVVDSLDIIVKYSEKLNAQLIERFELLGMNKLFDHLIRFYFEFIQADLIENLNHLLEIVFFLLIKFSGFKAFNINAYQNHDQEDYIDILDVLISSVLLERQFLLSENPNNIKIIQLVMHLLYRLSSFPWSNEILRLKFRKFGLFNDFLQRFTIFRKFGCLNLVFLLISNLVDKKIYNDLIFVTTGVVDNTLISSIKVYLKNYLYSIHDAVYVSTKIHTNGRVVYNLTPEIIFPVDYNCDLELAIKGLGDFIEVDMMHRKYMCYLCLEDGQCLDLFLRMLQFSVDDEEKLAAIRIVWLLVINKTIASKIKLDYKLIDFLKDCTNSHKNFHMRTFAGAILWNTVSKFENDGSKIGGFKTQKRDHSSNGSGYDSDGINETLVKLSIQESEDS
jgi:hypothetical protein